jgi:hypothetical protein
MSWIGVALVAAFVLLVRLAARRGRQARAVPEWRATIYAFALTAMLLSGVALIFVGF